jgi:hypothetical protein
MRFLVKKKNTPMEQLVVHVIPSTEEFALFLPTLTPLLDALTADLELGLAEMIEGISDEEGPQPHPPAASAA